MDWFWQVFILLFVFIPLTLMWIYALIDVFLNPGLSVLARVLWLVVILFIPFFGFLAYYIFRPVRERTVILPDNDPLEHYCDSFLLPSRGGLRWITRSAKP